MPKRNIGGIFKTAPAVTEPVIRRGCLKAIEWSDSHPNEGTHKLEIEYRPQEYLTCRIWRVSKFWDGRIEKLRTGDRFETLEGAGLFLTGLADRLTKTGISVTFIFDDITENDNLLD